RDEEAGCGRCAEAVGSEGLVEHHLNYDDLLAGLEAHLRVAGRAGDGDVAGARICAVRVLEADRGHPQRGGGGLRAFAEPALEVARLRAMAGREHEVDAWRRIVRLHAGPGERLSVQVDERAARRLAVGLGKRTPAPDAVPLERDVDLRAAPRRGLAPRGRSARGRKRRCRVRVRSPGAPRLAAPSRAAAAGAWAAPRRRLRPAGAAVTAV